MIEKYRKHKNRRDWFAFLLCLVHHHSLELMKLVSDVKLNKDLHNTLFALLISIYEFVSHYGILSGTAWAQIDRNHNRKSTVIM